MLPHLPEIFRKLRAGYHFSAADGEEFGVLRDRYEEYRDYFAQIDLDLVRHPRGFMYFESSANELRSGETRLASLLLFALILIEAIGDKGESVSGWLFGGVREVSDLPHFSTQERYREHLRELGITKTEDLKLKCLKPLERLGMVEFENETQIRFRAPFHRFIDLCMEFGGEDDLLEQEAGDE